MDKAHLWTSLHSFIKLTGEYIPNPDFRAAEALLIAAARDRGLGPGTLPLATGRRKEVPLFPLDLIERWWDDYQQGTSDEPNAPD